MVARSLLDEVDLARVRAAGSAAAGVADPALGTLLVCLTARGVLHHDPTDPGWIDRDRLLIDAALGLSVPRPLAEAVDGDVVAVAVGLAAACARSGSLFRVVAVIDRVALRSGAAWEAAQSAAGANLRDLVVAGPLGGGAAMLAAAGWDVVPAGADPVEVLWALDRCWRSDRPSGVDLR